MKKLTALLLVALTALCSCQKQEEKLSTAVSGEIINPKGSIVSFQIGEEKVTDTLDAENKFTTTLPIEEPTGILFEHGGEYTRMHLRPGDQLSMSLNTNEFDESLSYTGTGAENNRYYAAMKLLNDSLMDFRSMFKLPEDSFLLVIDSISEMKVGYLGEFGIKDEHFIRYVSEGQKWETAGHKLNYENYHKMFLKLDSFRTSESYFGFIDELDINDTSQLKYPQFIQYVESLISKAASHEMAEGKNYINLMASALNQNVTEAAIKEAVLYNLLSRNFTYIEDEARVALLKDWRTLNPSEDHLTSINELEEKWNKLMPGNPAPSFTYASLEGDTLSLEDFKGKLVYVDVWATWCGPCIGEHPAMEKLQERFKDDDVVFVSVSIDRSPEPWQNMIEKKALGGVHLYAPGEWKASIMQDYVISGIPRFILIDREGKIVSANASRPSGDIGDEIEALLRAA